MEHGTCKSCGCKVIWIRDQKGKRLPVNKTRVRIYDKVGTTPPEWRYLEEFDKPRLVYISHFVSCPHATFHSKTKPPSPLERLREKKRRAADILRGTGRPRGEGRQ